MEGEGAIKRRHQKLLTSINNTIDQDSRDYENFVQMMKSKVEDGVLNSCKSLPQKFELLESRGHIKPGGYQFLKSIAKDVHLQNVVELIENAEVDIAQIEKNDYDDSVKRQKLDNEIQDIYVRQYTFGNDAFPGYKYQCDTIHRICKRYHRVLKKCGLEETINIVSNEDRLYCKVNIAFAYKSTEYRCQAEQLEKCIFDKMQPRSKKIYLMRMKSGALLEKLIPKCNSEPVIIVTFPDHKEHTVKLCNAFMCDVITEKVAVFVIDSAVACDKRNVCIYHSTEENLFQDINEFLENYAIKILFAKCDIIKCTLVAITKTKTVVNEKQTLSTYKDNIYQSHLKDVDIIPEFQYDTKAMMDNHVEIKGIVTEIRGAFLRSKLDRSKWPEIPIISEHSKKISAALHQVDHVTGVVNSFSYGKIEIYFGDSAVLTQKDKLRVEEEIFNIFKRYGEDESYYHIVYGNPMVKPYVHRCGDKLHSKHVSSTLGGFVWMRTFNSSSAENLSDKVSALSLDNPGNDTDYLCALVSGHFVVLSCDDNVYLDDRCTCIFAKILRDPSDRFKVNKNDIAVVKVTKEQQSKCITAILNPEQVPVYATLFDIDEEDTDYLGGMQVYKWGAATGLTFGVCVGYFDMLNCIIIEGKNDKPFAEPGDSGAMICSYKNNETVLAIGIFMGQYNSHDVPSKRTQYMASLLKSGLNELSEKFNACFDLCNEIDK